jgi:hypothetical protein
MFDGQPNARADLTAGALYAVAGEAEWIYFGQVTPEKKVGFFCRRHRSLPPPEIVLASSIISVVAVAHPSITRAMRNGLWKKLGRFPVADALVAPTPSVNWPVGTLVVTVCERGKLDRNTRAEDPAIQDMELMAVWDAEQHIPARMTADFEPERAEWHVGGPIWKERRIKEEMAKRFPDAPWHALPNDWVPITPR